MSTYSPTALSMEELVEFPWQRLHQNAATGDCDARQVSCLRLLCELANSASSCRLLTCAIVNVYHGPHRGAGCLHDDSHANQVLQRVESEVYNYVGIKI